MRLWTVHPRYLDAKGLVAAWREALLAQKVLLGQTRGYRRHPQLIRFQTTPAPVETISAFLRGLADEADARDYRFDRGKIHAIAPVAPLAETEGQLSYEWQHLLAKLRQRAPKDFARHRHLSRPKPHPLFTLVPGPVRDWEKQI